MGNSGRILLALACTLFALSWWSFKSAESGLDISHFRINGTPVSVFQKTGSDKAPVVLIAHGFAGSQTLMKSFALSIAQAGYIAVTFDFLGHGANRRPLSGDVTREDGATAALLAQMEDIRAFAEPLSDGRLAVLGHSMASDIVVRYALAHEDVAATIAVSMFSPVVTPNEPRNLLVLVGDYEGMLKREALRAVGLSLSEGSAEDGFTYGETNDGSARRASFIDGAEHVGVLFAGESMTETVDWLNAVFDKTDGETAPAVAHRGFAIIGLILAVLLAAWPLSRLLPVLSREPVGASLSMRAFLVPALVPAIATPILLYIFPVHFLPIVVADYLAVHFAVYGLLTLLALRAFRHRLPALDFGGGQKLKRFAGASAGVLLFYILFFIIPVHLEFTHFIPGAGRFDVLLVMLAGLIVYFIADEWLTRGDGPHRLRYTLSKVCFLVSLAVATVLDLEGLFFLIIIIPLIIVFFLIFGLFSNWIYARAHNPALAAFANAIAFAVALTATFPILSG